MRTIARPVLNGLIAVGLVIAVWPVGQTVYGLWSQRSLAAQWQSEKKERQPVPNRTATIAAKAGAQTTKNSTNSPTLAVAVTKRTREPWPLTKFSIPNLELETYVVQGIDDASLRRGPGHYPSTALPGSGNCVIAGHRNVYGSFFARIDQLLPGADIILESRKGTWKYKVRQVFMVTDTDRSILAQPPAGSAPILTLITCTVPHTANRVILRAELDQEE